MAEVLALVPARGGSKSVPRKNLLMVGGKPLIAHSIGQALSSRFVTRTVVSTDDLEIADVARTYGADVPFLRPAVFADDHSLDLDVFRHALEWLRDEEGYRCDLVVHLRPTGPVRRVEIIDAAIARMLATPDADALRSVSTPGQSPYKMWRLTGDATDRIEPLVRLPDRVEAHSSPRQGLPPVFWQNGYVDIVRPRTILEQGRMAGEVVLPFIIEEPVLELDYPESIPEIEAALAALARGAWPPARRGDRHPV
jgi:CMP-N,N'-diacetyllegionaminic acid synthase